jgi:hypothetical protein
VILFSTNFISIPYYSSLYELKTPRKGLRIPNTDPAPFVFCEFCKSMQTQGNAPQGPKKRVYRNSEVRRSGVRCAAGCCIKAVKSVFRARAPRASAMRGRLLKYILNLVSRAIVVRRTLIEGIKLMLSRESRARTRGAGGVCDFLCMFCVLSVLFLFVFSPFVFSLICRIGYFQIVFSRATVSP